MKIETLQQYIELIDNTVTPRRQLTRDHLKGKLPQAENISKLQETFNSLNESTGENGKLLLNTDSGSRIEAGADYEIAELEKDLIYFKENEDKFLDFLDDVMDNFRKQVKQGREFLSGISIKNFITDRDGTVNNYCARYNTSVQSAYNAIFLTRFASTVENPVLLTSAPLENKGLKDISVVPRDQFVFAGSKGREYEDRQGNKGNYPIEPHKQQLLDELNSKLKKLLGKSEYEVFARIGSGLQFKFGQTTVARQDINHSIDEQTSEDFLKKIKLLVNELDPVQQDFRIEDTGLDIEIILTIEGDNDGLKDFDKGDGILFLNDELKLDLQTGPNLICGDTNSDVPMVEQAMKLSSDTMTIFVTTDKRLKKKVKKACKKVLFVDNPDTLITILNLKTL